MSASARVAALSAESLAASLIALREFNFECIEEQLDEQDDLRARGIDMT